MTQPDDNKIMSFGDYLAKYFPERWKKLVHLAVRHPDVLDRPCGCPDDDS